MVNASSRDIGIRLLIADDQALVRGALGALLELEPDLTVVGMAADGAEAVRLAEELRPDVCLMDIQMPGMDGVEATRRIREVSGGTRILVVTTFARPGYLRSALEAGASGFIVKDTPAEELAEAVRRVQSGLRVLDPALAADSLFDGANPLSDRERQVLRLAVDGRSAAMIAAEVFLSAGTVRNHLSAAIGKTGAANRAQAVRIALDKGWI
ncbi:response regulator transcription factor [Microbacterium sp.]|uniref:response regulator transcription factor n=1 Tax=unclassified Microbacterium TaxID=2609290 RepID=UPI0026358A48|nr:response regulator transcription factor [Microbacterium sp.]MCV0335518.1 response regulator transcription factor [Microbacterium sp.]MCV0376986.1 response regulator transcription factor [Microbacterium sp.]MCV0390536.1 response regulator transcription factor [Microbacterium sp.]MCV0418271.1 response regulator transcription factor [Microbacterium sp.]MCV0422061.1 response regulator transcription factor [Microbacterium sp.]